MNKNEQIWEAVMGRYQVEYQTNPVTTTLKDMPKLTGDIQYAAIKKPVSTK